MFPSRYMGFKSIIVYSWLNFLTYFTEQLQSNTEILLEQAPAFYLVLSQAPRDKSKMEAETTDTTKMLPSEDYMHLTEFQTCC